MKLIEHEALHITIDRHPPCGGCGLKFRSLVVIKTVLIWSPSVWRVWIEMRTWHCILHAVTWSPSVWRVWIEIISINMRLIVIWHVTLRVEGVD